MFFGNLLQPDYVIDPGNAYTDKISMQIAIKCIATDEGSYNADQLETLRSCLSSTALEDANAKKELIPEA